jgi:two-component system, OmpR family, copper resistance phosphate regulon response regulator CusR
MNDMLILLVDGNSSSARFVSQGLSETGLLVDIAGDGQTANQLFDAGNFDLVILDLSLPRLDGFELCRHFRRRCSEVPILILSGSNDTPDKMADLQSVADDYLPKPFQLGELVARVHALLRQRIYPRGRMYKVLDLEVDPFRQTVTRGGKAITLSTTEFALLVLLLVNKNKVVPRTLISASIWGGSFRRRTNLLSVYISYLRRKIDRGFGPPLILTVAHEGYMLKEP